MALMTTEAAYAELISKLKRAHVLGTVNGLLGWDEQVNLPPDSADLRAEQLALHGRAPARRRQRSADGELLTLLEGRTGTNSTADQQVVLQYGRRDYDRVVKLPPEFVREKARHSSKAFHAWAECKAAVRLRRLRAVPRETPRAGETGGRLPRLCRPRPTTT